MKTFMSADYYKIYDRFSRQSNYSIDIKNNKPNGDDCHSNSDYCKFSNENSSECSVKFLDYCMQPPPWKVVNTKDINISTKERDIKDKLKEYQSIKNNFILSKSNLLDWSIGIYKHVWEDFVKFSLSIGPIDVSSIWDEDLS